MPKNKISEYSATNSANTDIGGINIDEGCAPSGINNAIREVMVQLKNFQTGASGDAFTFAGGVLISGTTNTISGAAVISGNINSSGSNTFSGSQVISGNINSSGSTNTFSGGVVHSGTNTFSSSVIISGNINSSGTNTFSSSQVISGNINSSGTNTFSGTTVMSGANTVALAAGAVGTPSLYANGDANTGVWFPAADTIAASTGGSERMRIDSSGNVGIGTSSPRNVTNYKFISTDATTGSGLSCYQNGTLGLSIYSVNGVSYVSESRSAVIAFETNATERMRILANGTIQTVSTISVGNATPSTSGAGITFPATQSASTDANTLDDYEEGTFTPTLTGESSAGTTTYTVQTGAYTKIGRQVTVTISFAYSAMTGTGNMLIGSLPFTSANVSNQNYTAAIWASNLNWSGGSQLTVYLSPNETRGSIWYMSDDGAAGQQQCVNESATIYITLTYFTA